MRTSEDWWAVWLGLALLIVSWAVTAASFPDDVSEGQKVSSPLQPFVAKLAEWTTNPIDSVYVAPPSGDAAVADAPKPVNHILGLVGVCVIGLIGFGLGKSAGGTSFKQFAPGYLLLFALAAIAMGLSVHSTSKDYNLEFALWALVMGVVLNLVLGTPKFVRPALATEFYIKTGLVLMGAELLLPQLMILGVPGFCVAWVVTPIVFISTYIFGQKVLKIESKSLNMVISADMSVCGVSAAIATAAACKAKKEELSLAIGISLTFTVLMIVVMPAVIKALGMGEILGGAWIGGTVDSSGAVVAAGELVGDRAAKVAATVKLLQNVLIGFVAFGVAMYWVNVVEREPDSPATETDDVPKTAPPRPSLWVIWERFPKFILGFFAASALATLLFIMLPHGKEQMASSKDVTKTLMSWFFAMAFISIGLEIDFAQFRKSFKGGKPLVLYICGQTLNIVLTLAMAWVMFENVFKDQIENEFPPRAEEVVTPAESQDPAATGG